MAVKTFKPTTPGLRFRTVSSFEELSQDNSPEKSLTKGKRRIAGRGAGGRIAVRRRGGGHKRKFREIDFFQNKFEIEGIVKTIEYDPNRTGYIALIAYKDGEKRYVLATHDMKVGQTIICGENVKAISGNRLPLRNIPLGTEIFNIELKPKRGGKLVRSAGNSATLYAKEGEYVTIRLPSGETRRIHKNCFATIGRVSNPDNEKIKLGKAGRTRWKGRRPKVRGTVMNPVDHPHGGGEGKTKGGRHPVTPWGVPTKGHKTRKKRNITDDFIISRKSKKRK
jgi:large subunit ribosomal protein L2